jgi:hypothetical protein
MQLLEVSGAVRLIYKSLGVKGLKQLRLDLFTKENITECVCVCVCLCIIEFDQVQEWPSATAMNR